MTKSTKRRYDNVSVAILSTLSLLCLQLKSFMETAKNAVVIKEKLYQALQQVKHAEDRNTTLQDELVKSVRSPTNIRSDLSSAEHAEGRRRNAQKIHPSVPFYRTKSRK